MLTHTRVPVASIELPERFVDLGFAEPETYMDVGVPVANRTQKALEVIVTRRDCSGGDNVIGQINLAPSSISEFRTTLAADGVGPMLVPLSFEVAREPACPVWVHAWVQASGPSLLTQRLGWVTGGQTVRQRILIAARNAQAIADVTCAVVAMKGIVSGIKRVHIGEPFEPTIEGGLAAFAIPIDVDIADQPGNFASDDVAFSAGGNRMGLVRFLYENGDNAAIRRSVRSSSSTHRRLIVKDEDGDPIAGAIGVTRADAERASDILLAGMMHRRSDENGMIMLGMDDPQEFTGVGD